jgi:hypothetical protein
LRSRESGFRPLGVNSGLSVAAADWFRPEGWFRLKSCVAKVACRKGGWVEMSEHMTCDSSVSSSAAVESLEILLDYAIAEGSALRLPVFVLLLRMANLELTKSAPDGWCLNSDSRSLCDAGERVAS